MPYFEITIILALIVLNGVFAMSELAIVSSKKVHLRRLAEEGNKAALQALALAEDTSRFLPTVQVGMTLIGVLAGAISGAKMGDNLTDYLADMGIAKDHAEIISFGFIVIIVTYMTLIVGELVPKELALRKPEKYALFVAPLINALSKIAWPAVWLLHRSSAFLLWLLRAGDKPESTVTQEEVKAMIAEGADYGVFAERESEILTGIMLLADKPVRAFMVPRTNVLSFDCDATAEQVKKALTQYPYSRFPVRPHDDEHHVLGVVQTKDILTTLLFGGDFDLKKIITEVTVFPDNTNALKVMEHLRSSPTHVAIIIDEHGAFEGIVTLIDLFAAVTGELGRQGEMAAEIRERADGSWLMDGSVLIERVYEEIGMRGRPKETGFHTLAGFILNHYHALPKTGDSFAYQGFQFEVVDMDGFRIDKVLVKKVIADSNTASAANE